MWSQIGPFTPTKAEKAKIKVKIRLNLHGIISLEAATVSGCVYLFVCFLFVYHTANEEVHNVNGHVYLCRFGLG